MGYEHLKKYLFEVDNINNSHFQTFSERFVSAGIASSFAHFINGGHGLLPLRFASFFGSFEAAKDLINKRHEEFNLSAMTDGVVSAKQVIGKQMFKGCVSSLTKFLPSCIVCSCAFEYSKRYLSTL